MPKHHLRPTASSLRRAPSSEPCTEPHSTVRRSSLTSPSHRKVLGAEPQIGERLGERFELEAILGQGSSGKVYAARDLESGRGYALKLLLGVSPSSIYRLKREYRALASIHHPNLVSLEGLFHAEPHWFVVMERIDGRTFVDGLSDDPRATERELRARLEQLALGVGALHAAGLVQRDLKPGNVLVSASGRVVVVDFGLAHERRLAVRSRPRASFAGTPAFAAPEQLEGGAPSYAADRYAIGAMLYLALTGSIPHERGSVAELAARKRSLPPPPSAVRPGVPPDLESLCLALLSPAPEQRPELTEWLPGRWAACHLALEPATPAGGAPVDP